MNGKKADFIIVDEAEKTREEMKNKMTQLCSDNSKMKVMVDDLRNQLFEKTQILELKEKEIQSSVRLLWAAARAQPDHTLNIPKVFLVMVDSNCQLESGYDQETEITFFIAR